MNIRCSRRALLAAAIAAGIAPRVAAAQASRVKVVGYLSGGQGPEGLAKMLARRGYVEGRNVRIEIRIPKDWETGSLDKAARELVAARPDALYAFMANRVAALAAATRTIPIVAGGVSDPVGAGFAKSLRQPGGNVTGLSFGFPESAELVVAILKSIRPGRARVGGIFAKGMPEIHRGTWWTEACAKAGLEWRAVTVGTPDEAATFLAGMTRQATFVAPIKDVAVVPQILAAATRLGVATVGQVEQGALMSYGMDFANYEERIASILDQVLRGANPATIPFELPDRPGFEWNRTTAKALGIEMPREIALRVTRFVD